MKKLFLLLQLVMLVVFASCSSEDPDPIPQPGAEVENTILCLYGHGRVLVIPILGFITSSSPIYKTLRVRLLTKVDLATSDL